MLPAPLVGLVAPLALAALPVAPPLVSPAVSARAISAPAVSAGARAVAPGGDKVPLQWGREDLDPAALPETLTRGAHEAVERWFPWAAETGYRMDLSMDGRVLLLSFADKRGTKNAKKNMERIEEVLTATDAILPLPTSRAANSGAGADDDDDESYEWGRIPLESQTAVLLEIADPVHHEAAVSHIVAGEAYLGPWGAAAKRMTGFVLELPLVGAWQPDVGIKEDWEGNPTNEMVNRLTQLLTLRRFGRQPYWLALGIAWYVEMETMDGIYCFPYRSGFVSSSEHTNWEKLVENRYRRRKQALTMGEVALLERGKFDKDGAHNAWGTVSFLVRHHPGALPEILDDLYAIWDREGREDNGDGTWERIPDFEPAVEAQLAVFDQHVPGFIEELQKFFAEGKKYKP